MQKLLYALLPSLLLFSCVNGENPDSVALETFTVTAAPRYFGNYAEAYIILHDLSGTPIDYKQIEDGETVEFQLDKSKKHHLTVYEIDAIDEKDVAFLTTTLDQDLGENLTLSRSKGSGKLGPNQIGNFQVEISNNEPIAAVLSSRAFLSDPVTPSNTISPTMKLFSDENRYLASAITESGHIRYQFIENPELNKTYELSFDTMKEFDQVIKIPTSEYSLFNYEIYSFIDEVDTDALHFNLAHSSRNGTYGAFYELGYLNEIENYLTQVSGQKSNNAKVWFQYSKYGPPPSAIEFMDINDILVSKYKISDFQYGTSIEDGLYQSTFRGSEGNLDKPGHQYVEWTVSGRTTHFSLDLPQELQSKNKLLADLNDLKLYRASIWKYLEGSEFSQESTTEYTIISQYY